MTLMTKTFNALCPPGRGGAMQAVAVKMLRDSLANVQDSLYSYLESIKKDLGGSEMREDAIVNWENEFRLSPAASDTLAERRAGIEVAWALTGFLGPGYIQASLQNAGFDVVVRENLPAINLDIGTHIQCIAESESGEDPYPQCASHDDAYQCGEGYDGYFLGNGWLQQTSGAKLDPFNVPTSLVGANATQCASYLGAYTCAAESASGADPYPQCGSDNHEWEHIFVIEAADGSLAEVPTQRREIFEREVLRLKPAHLGIFVRVRYN